MAIERNNSFHLMLSDDEASLLRLLAEREGLNASDYLRTLLRRDAGGGARVPAMLGAWRALGAAGITAQQAQKAKKKAEKKARTRKATR